MTQAIKTLACGLLLLLAWQSAARAQSWTDQAWLETADAPGAPDTAVQRTLGRDSLRAIVGVMDSGAGDSRDAFCVRIPDLARFVATTDPSIVPFAGADFAAGLLLLGPDGRPLAVGEGPTANRQTLVAETPSETASTNGLPGRGREYSLVVSGSGGAYSVGLVGAEGCGTLDLVFAVNDNKMDRYCLGHADASGDFHCHGVTGDTIEANAVVLGDFDDDNDLDAVFGTTDVNEPNRICPGDSVGRFSFEECAALGAAGDSSRSAAVGDLDDDNALDVVFANATSAPVACLGDGALGFACQPIEAADSVHGRAVALGHLDDDGNLDAVFGNVGEPSRACLGNGIGGFSSCSDVAGVNEVRRAVVLGHFDGDVNLDAAFTTSTGALSCLGDGTGSFTCTTIVGVSSSVGVAAGLVDDDPHLDLVFSRHFTVIGLACLGDGLGGFACTPFGTGDDTRLATGVALADLDNDGVLDAAISTKVGDSAICFGDGAGSFTGCRPINENKYRAQGIAVGALAPASVGHDDFETGDLRAWATSFPDG